MRKGAFYHGTRETCFEHLTVYDVSHLYYKQNRITVTHMCSHTQVHKTAQEKKEVLTQNDIATHCATQAAKKKL